MHQKYFSFVNHWVLYHSPGRDEVEDIRESFEQDSKDRNLLDFSDALYPIIVEVGLLLALLIISLYSLVSDVGLYGCLKLWNRESIFIHLEWIVFMICFLNFVRNLQVYIDMKEMTSW